MKNIAVKFCSCYCNEVPCYCLGMSAEIKAYNIRHVNINWLTPSLDRLQTFFSENTFFGSLNEINFKIA